MITTGWIGFMIVLGAMLLGLGGSALIAIVLYDINLRQKSKKGA